jgi:hypothetical protein
MEAEKIRHLLTVQELDLDQAAREVQVTLPTACNIRIQALNLILGRCVLCGYQKTQGGICKRCSEKPPAQRLVEGTGRELLMKWSPVDQLIHRNCVKCRRPYTLSARYLMTRLETGDTSIRNMCKLCWTENLKENGQWALRPVASSRKVEGQEASVTFTLTKETPASTEKSEQVPEEVVTITLERGSGVPVTPAILVIDPADEENKRKERIARIEWDKARKVKAQERREAREAERRAETEPYAPSQEPKQFGDVEELTQCPFGNSETILNLKKIVKKTTGKKARKLQPKNEAENASKSEKSEGFEA